MSDQVSQVKIELSAEDRASAVVKSFRSEIEKAIKSLKELAEIKIPDKLKAKLDAPDARAAVAGFDKAAAAARKLGDIQSRASRERRADAQAEAGERRAFDAADVAALRAKMGFTSRMNRQRAGEEQEAARARKAYESDALNALRERFAFQGRMARQQVQEARETARQQVEASRQAARAAGEAARQQAATIRAQNAQAREAIRDQARATRTMVTGAGQVRNGVGRAAVVGAAGAATLGAGSRRALDSFTRSGVSIDDAMTQAQIHIFGTMPAGEARKAAEGLRKRLMPIATRLGAKTADLIGAYVEASQAGVDSDILDQVTELGSKYAKMNKLSLPNTLEESGYALQGLKTFGKVTNETVANYFNKMSYLVATTAANRTQMSSFGKRGLAAGASVGMSADDTLAFGAAATAAGAEGNQAARMLSSQSGRVAGWASRARDITRKHTRTEEDKLFLSMPGQLGFGSYSSLAASFKKDFLGTFALVQERLKKIADPLKRREIEKQLYGQEFGALTDSMVMGSNLRNYRNKLKSPEASHFIDNNWAKETGAFGFVIDQIKKVAQDLADSFGLALKPFYEDLRDYALKTPEAFGAFEDAFRASLTGFVRGLGSDDGTMASLLSRYFGDPSGFRVNVKAIGDAAKGFGEGLADVARTIRSLFQAFSGGDGSAESMGRWAARFMGFSAAMLVAAPALTILTGFATAIVGFVGSIRAAMAGLRALSGAEAGGGILARLGLGGLVGRILGGFGLAIVAALGEYRGKIATMLGAPAIGTLIAEGVRDFLAEVGTTIRKALSLKGIANALRGLGEEFVPAPLRRYLDGGDKGTETPPASVQKQSAAEDWRGHIVPSAYSQDGRLAASVERLERAIGSDRARIQLASFNGSTVSALGRATAIGGGSGDSGIVPGDSGAGFGPSGLPKAPGMSVPGWYGRGSSGSTVARGALAANQQEAFKAAREAGLSETAARALVANMSGESLANPQDHHWDRKHMSQGIVQWDPQRAEAIRSQFGKLPKDMTVSEQTRAAIWEIKSNPRFARTARALQGNDPGAMLDSLVRNYEAPADPDRAIAERQRHFNGFQPSEPGTAAAKGGQFDGIRVKGAQATAGGATAEGVTDLARAIQNDIPGVKHFSSFNDLFHKGTGSKHAAGLAFDTSIADPSKSAETAEAIRAKLKAAGLSPEAFRVIDEYRNPSARATGGHIHTQFNSRESAEAYHRSVAPSELARGARPRPSPEELAGAASTAPKPVQVMGPQGGEGGGIGGTTVHAPVTINAGAQSPSDIANSLQRHVAEARNFRSHDMEPELT